MSNVLDGANMLAKSNTSANAHTIDNAPGQSGFR
jgi:hypothetical protein